MRSPKVAERLIKIILSLTDMSDHAKGALLSGRSRVFLLVSCSRINACTGLTHLLEQRSKRFNVLLNLS